MAKLTMQLDWNNSSTHRDRAEPTPMMCPSESTWLISMLTLPVVKSKATMSDTKLSMAATWKPCMHTSRSKWAKFGSEHASARTVHEVEEETCVVASSRTPLQYFAIRDDGLKLTPGNPSCILPRSRRSLSAMKQASARTTESVNPSFGTHRRKPARVCKIIHLVARIMPWIRHAITHVDGGKEQLTWKSYLHASKAQIGHSRNEHARTGTTEGKQNGTRA